MTSTFGLGVSGGGGGGSAAIGSGSFWKTENPENGLVLKSFPLPGSFWKGIVKPDCRRFTDKGSDSSTFFLRSRPVLQLDRATAPVLEVLDLVYKKQRCRPKSKRWPAGQTL